MPETPIQSPRAVQGTSVENNIMTEQIGLLQNPSSPVLTATSKQQRLLRNISSLAVMVKRAELSPSFEVYNDDEELLLKGKISGKKVREQGNQKDAKLVMVYTSENESFLKLEFEEDEASQDIKSFNVMLPEQDIILASVDFDRKATSTCIRDVMENQNYTVKLMKSTKWSIFHKNPYVYIGHLVKAQDGRDLAKIEVKTEVTTNMGGFKPTSKSPIFALTFEPYCRPEQKAILVGYTIAIGVFFSKETKTTLYGAIFFIFIILSVCLGIFLYFSNNMQSTTSIQQGAENMGKPIGNQTSSSNTPNSTISNSTTITTNTTQGNT